MDQIIPDGTVRTIDGTERIHYDGYWIKTYQPPTDTLLAKKKLIEALTRRLFNHVEHGINIPGNRLREARAAFETETEPSRKRVKGAMLAGALFNRATAIFTTLVDLQQQGVLIDEENSLMIECGTCLQEALNLGQLVLHRSGVEGIDELWGEPFRAFSIPVEAFYESRYIKIAQTMRDIDRIAEALSESLSQHPEFSGINDLLGRFAETARIKCETLRTDPVIFDVWPEFVVASERLASFSVKPISVLLEPRREMLDEGLRLVEQGRSLVTDIVRARTPMPKSTREFVERCHTFGERTRPLHPRGEVLSA